MTCTTADAARARHWARPRGAHRGQLHRHDRPNFAGRALKVSRTDVIALIAPDLPKAFLTELMLGVEEEATRLGLHALARAF
ncbi:MAG TPA: hypothetical protein VE462_13810 [Propionibacteriaceae bacterium]|nr:hypothetical protein [Propionibacteriaceae bacterium]